MFELGNETLHSSSTLSPRFAIISVPGEIFTTGIEAIRTTKTFIISYIKAGMFKYIVHYQHMQDIIGQLTIKAILVNKGNALYIFNYSDNTIHNNYCDNWW